MKEVAPKLANTISLASFGAISFIDKAPRRLYNGSIPLFRKCVVMQYLSSFFILLGFTFLGELLHVWIPLPIPAAIYGILLLFAALCLKLVRPEQVKPAGNFLLSILPVLFVAPAVNLLDSWQAAAENGVAIILIMAVSTVAVFGVSGLVTQLALKKAGKRHG